MNDSGMRRFAGKVVAVTGAANGIGAATARRFQAEGAALAVIDCEADTLAAAFPNDERVFRMVGDCRDGAVLTGFFRDLEAKLGPVDVLFNNVGQSARERASMFDVSQEETWRFVVEITLMTTMRASRLVVPGMIARGRGRIVNMSSETALVGDAGLADYVAAKMGVIGFTRALAREVAPRGITVNVVAPGAIATRAHDRMPREVIERLIRETPVGFVGEPQDVAAAVTFLASDEARFITGQTLVIDGGRWMI